MAAAAPILALIAGGIALSGVAGAYLDMIAPLMGFQLFAGGALLGGLASVIVGLLALFMTRGGRDPEGRTKALLGLALGMGLMIVVLGLAATGGMDAPPINDITTDLANPPQFASPKIVPEYSGRNMSYPVEFIPVVRASYSDLGPLDLSTPPDETFTRALVAARSLGWVIVAESPQTGIFDAQDVSKIFRFVDDITVRIVARGDGSRVDMRSKSRDGRSDLGANAARIRTFFDVLR